jgi:predicted subunit of tRNA(5-methylaminomethyl-2-thiouridylate) methyltransferase
VAITTEDGNILHRSNTDTPKLFSKKFQTGENSHLLSFILQKLNWKLVLSIDFGLVSKSDELRAAAQFLSNK